MGGPGSLTLERNWTSELDGCLFVFYQIYWVKKDLLWKTAGVVLIGMEYEGEYPGCYNSVQGTEEKSNAK